MKKSTLSILLAGFAPFLTIVLSAEEQTQQASATPLSEQCQKLENNLDNVFKETCAKLHGKHEKGVAFSSLMDVRENKDAYVVRICDETKVKVTYDNGVLHISSVENAESPFEQDIPITAPVEASKMKIEHKEGIFVVTLPKHLENAVTVEEKIKNRDKHIIKELQLMQDRMDQMTRDVLVDIPGEDISIIQKPSFGSMVKIDDLDGKYIVHFYLPDHNLSDVKIKVKGNQLQIAASGDSKQAITLPGPVNDEGMKVDRNNETIIVTLPKK